jgi:Xaa-Pro aminopeptidase
MLRADEVEWLNGYHEQVRARLAPHVSGDALRWPEAGTRPIGRGH